MPLGGHISVRLGLAPSSPASVPSANSVPTVRFQCPRGLWDDFFQWGRPAGRPHQSFNAREGFGVISTKQGTRSKEPFFAAQRPPKTALRPLLASCRGPQRHRGRHSLLHARPPARQNRPQPPLSGTFSSSESALQRLTDSLDHAQMKRHRTSTITLPQTATQVKCGDYP